MYHGSFRFAVVLLYRYTLGLWYQRLQWA